MVFSPNPSIFEPDDKFNLSTGITFGGIDYTAGTSGVVYNVAASEPDIVGSGGSEQVSVTCSSTNCFTANGALTYGQDASPAPVPGSGLLSYIALGFAGLLFVAKTLWGNTRGAMGRVADANRAEVEREGLPVDLRHLPTLRVGALH